MRTDGGRTLAAWGMGMAILVATIAFSTLLLSYFYLRVESPQWPPAGVDDPALWRGVAAAVAVVAAAIALGWARRSIGRGSTRRLSIGVLAGGALTAAGGLIQVADLRTLDFSAQDHAYGSIVYVVAGAMVALALVGCVIDGVVLSAAVRGHFTPRRHAAIINAHRYAMVLAGLWAIGAATLYLTPRLT